MTPQARRRGRNQAGPGRALMRRAFSAIDVSSAPIDRLDSCPRALPARSFGRGTNSHHRTSRLDSALSLTSG